MVAMLVVAGHGGTLIWSTLSLISLRVTTSSKTINSRDTWPILMVVSFKVLNTLKFGECSERVKILTHCSILTAIITLEVLAITKLMLLDTMKSGRNGSSPKNLMVLIASRTFNTDNGPGLEMKVKTGLSTNKPSVDHGRSGTSSLIMVWLMAFTDSDKLNTQSSLPTSIKMRSRLLIMNKTSGESSVVLTFTPFKVSEVVSFWELLLTILFTPVLKLVMPKLGISLKIKMVTTALEMSSEITGSESEKMVMISLLR
mmetsp:Transcript_23800/g.20723  ORF Transcript_23800/g.20723 Transcript_23800/m.20723 type:complete len:257 (+) Transcript_23800:452-1222(+)